MDTAQWPQMETSRASMMEIRGRTQKDEALNCPRCNSSNTKFCYYNNYSLSQPRYFCKTCRRYWTEGGSLRNVPVGGGSRKNKRSSSKKLVESASRNPKIHQGQDLNLAYPPPTQDYNNLSKFVQPRPQNSSSTSSSTRFNLNSSGLSSFVSIPVSDTNNSSGFAMQDDFKPTLNFCIDGLGNIQSGARLLFPMEELKQVQSSNELDQNRNQGESTGYWF